MTSKQVCVCSAGLPLITPAGHVPPPHDEDMHPRPPSRMPALSSPPQLICENGGTRDTQPRWRGAIPPRGRSAGWPYIDSKLLEGERSGRTGRPPPPLLVLTDLNTRPRMEEEDGRTPMPYLPPHPPPRPNKTGGVLARRDIETPPAAEPSRPRPPHSRQLESTTPPIRPILPSQLLPLSPSFLRPRIHKPSRPLSAKPLRPSFSLSLSLRLSLSPLPPQ